MTHWFEDLTKTVADEQMGRRTAIRRVAGAMAGVALTSAFPELALAKGRSKKNCSPPGDCSIGFTKCDLKMNTNCYCFTDVNGKGKCGCNLQCSQGEVCGSNAQCPKNAFCAVVTGCTGCTGSSGYCIPFCKKTCPSVKSGSLSAAHPMF